MQHKIQFLKDNSFYVDSILQITDVKIVASSGLGPSKTLPDATASSV